MFKMVVFLFIIVILLDVNFDFIFKISLCIIFDLWVMILGRLKKIFGIVIVYFDVCLVLL